MFLTCTLLVETQLAKDLQALLDMDGYSPGKVIRRARMPSHRLGEKPPAAAPPPPPVAAVAVVEPVAKRRKGQQQSLDLFLAAAPIPGAPPAAAAAVPPPAPATQPQSAAAPSQPLAAAVETGAASPPAGREPAACHPTQPSPPVFESVTLDDSEEEEEEAGEASLAEELEARVAAHVRLINSCSIALAAAVPDTCKARTLARQRAAAAADLEQLAVIFAPCAELA